MLAFGQADLVDHSPVVEAHLAAGRLPVLALAEAVQVTSDNAAANVLMRRLGGPAAVTRFWREIGDEISRIDGYEPTINVIPPGTTQNSTTPRAMAETVRRIVLGDVLADVLLELIELNELIRLGAVTYPICGAFQAARQIIAECRSAILHRYLGLLVQRVGSQHPHVLIGRHFCHGLGYEPSELVGQHPHMRIAFDVPGIEHQQFDPRRAFADSR